MYLYRVQTIQATMTCERHEQMKLQTVQEWKLGKIVSVCCDDNNFLKFFFLNGIAVRDQYACYT